MKKLKSSLRITEADAIVSTIARLYDADDTIQDDQFLKSTMDEIKTLSDEFSHAIKRDKVTIADVKEKDRKRDDAVRALASLLDGYAKMDSTKEAGTRLKNVFSKYGRQITSVSGAMESSYIESMLTDFSDSGYADDISNLSSVSDAISTLKTAEKSFKSSYDSYINDKNKYSTKRTASQIKEILLGYINGRVLPYLQGMSISNAEKYGKFSAMVYDEVEKVNQSIKLRAKYRQKETAEVA